MPKKYDFKTTRGMPLPFGANPTASGINFSIYSAHATGATLVLFASAVKQAIGEIELDSHINRTGDVWHIEIADLNVQKIRYGWRIDGPEGEEHKFNKNLIVLDPYTKVITGGANWGEPQLRHSIDDGDIYDDFPRRGAIPNKNFDWQGLWPIRRPLQDTVIYEMHVRGFTAHESADVAHPGTYKGVIEKIPYLKELGITAVELMPVFEFDENEHMRHTEDGEILRNFWGYSPVSFFAPKASYASDGRGGKQVEEFKEMVRELHQAGIEVYLDVVYNHTAEGDERGPVISFKGIDNSSYYILGKDGKYQNFSGCGNTFNCNDPRNQALIIDSLRYWVAEMRVDGFRFDLASILGRDPKGNVLKDPPLIERIAIDPVLADTKIIAEAWDAAGLNQVGNFPHFGRWSEWNGYYRDNVRMFWRGDKGMVSALASRVCGSDDLYKRNTRQSINFVTAHDGFTLNDLVSYSHKHNTANGENNNDGENNNHSMNLGIEGETSDPKINQLRQQMMKNFFLTMFVSQGVPMFTAGDEFARTQKGNNNAYCQDNEISYVDWSFTEKNAGLLRFVKNMIAFRKDHPMLRRGDFFKSGKGITWHGEKAGKPDWESESQWLAFMLDGTASPDYKDDYIFVMFNASSERRFFDVPDVGREWVCFADTNLVSPADICDNLDDAHVVGYKCAKYRVRPQSAVILVTRS